MRHAQTVYNAAKRYAGSCDVPLNEAGLRDAAQAGAKLAGFRFDVVITSTMKRTIQTASILVGDRVPMVRSRLCNERNFGVLEGHTWDEVAGFDPPVLMIKVGNDLHTVNPKGGEPFEDLWGRAKRFRRFVFRRFSGSNILVVSHGVFLQMFHGVLRGLTCIESLAVYPSNLELNVFRFWGDRLAAQKVVKLAAHGKVKF
jgi:broad specificity phosphatase PhoE